MRFHTCLIDEEIADMYIHYCENQGIIYETRPEGNKIHIELWVTKEEMALFTRWMLTTLYNQEVRHGQNNK